ncbi:ROK family protein [Crateriforma spongiae]|uniref:ROK family protein n=1 Tax=Crateriforma spongiae TaxID=2724528 RepID=UPI0014461558|nr:ROK family protein [Crateriforma spongiae]
MTSTPALIDIGDAKPPFYWGVDIGGTGIKIGLVDSGGGTVAYRRIPTRESEGPDAAVGRVAEVAAEIDRQLGIQTRVAAVGVGAPGPMDLQAGTLVQPPQLPSWWGYHLVDAIAQRFGRPVTFLNDANAAAYGEFWLGSGRADRSMVLLTLGTGVGGGLIVDGELVNGVNSFGSECGHLIVDPSPTARLCVWGGGRGQLEAYASASAVVQRTLQQLTRGQDSCLSGSMGGSDTELTAKRVWEAAIEGDQLALEIVDETAKWLGIGVTTIVHITDPGSVVLGGAMNFGGADCDVGRRFLKGVADEFQARTFDNVFEGTSIQFASLGGDAGYLGAAGYARHEHPRHD